jgi:hypothetical protein
LPRTATISRSSASEFKARWDVQCETPYSWARVRTYLRISRDRARVVLFGCKRILADDEVDDRDLMAIAASLRDMTTQLPADQYTPNSLTW